MNKSEKIHVNETVNRVELYCQTSGKPKPKVTWYKGDQLITNEFPYKYKLSQENTTLTILNLNYDDDGIYYCYASNLEKYPVANIYYSLKGLLII